MELVFPHEGGCACCRNDGRCNYCGTKSERHFAGLNHNYCTNGRCATCHATVCVTGDTETHGYGGIGDLIVSRNGWIMVHEDGSPVRVGEEVNNFRGNPATIEGGTPPHKPSSTGRVATNIGEFFPGVFGLKWRQ